MGVRPCVTALVLGVGVALASRGVAYAQADPDEPGIGAAAPVQPKAAPVQPKAPAVDLGDEPFPDPSPSATVAVADEEPGIASLASRPGPRRPAAGGGGLAEGVNLRFSYRTFKLPETTRDGPISTRFHAVAIEIYPISWFLRVGLSTQAGLEAESANHDWIITQGMMIGLQRPGHAVVPFVDFGVHVGVGTRTFYISEINREYDQLTLLWAYAGEAGIDWQFAGKTKTTLAVGFQRTTFFSNGTQAQPIATTSDTTITFKVGVGY